jgi:hypothetical protein
MSSIQADATCLPAILDLCEFGLETGDVGLAQSAVAELLKLDSSAGEAPSSLPPSLQARRWSLLARFSRATGDLTGCRELLMQALQHAPGDVHARDQLLLLVAR